MVRTIGGCDAPARVDAADGEAAATAAAAAGEGAGFAAAATEGAGFGSTEGDDCGAACNRLSDTASVGGTPG
jgi:hypothetical protein